MSAPPTVLVVEDEPGIREGLAAAVETLGYRAVTASGLAEARARLAPPPDCVLLDIRLRDGDGLDFLKELREGPLRDVPVVVATAYSDGERTIRAMRDGAFDYVTKPFDLPRLLSTVARAVEQRALARTIAKGAVASGEGGGLVGTSAAMLEIWKLIGRAAASTAPVLVRGETGTGKEKVARAIHAYSARSAAPFVAVNLAALPPGLIESELFGHEKGAFTGAVGRRAGRFELAHGGTLFLDEIGDLDPHLQTKLLRVLQDGTFERVGGESGLASAARVVSATSKPVRPDEPGCVLRPDLYYRLAVLEVEVPPLRARRSDVPQLVAHALRGTPARAVSEAAMERLLAYDWPGNVRELLHVVERASVLSGGEIIDVAALPEPLRGLTPRPADAAPAPPSRSGPASPWRDAPAPPSRDAPAPPSRDAPAAPPESAPAPADEAPALTLREAVAELERRMITAALARARGNRSEAARQLGIGRPQLYAKMQEHGVGAKGEGE